MKYAILSDIHANHAAFQAVYEDAKSKGVGGFIFLGDFIGYLGMPIEVLELLKEILEEYPDSEWVLGNHEVLLQVAVEYRSHWELEFPGYENQDFAQIEELKKVIGERLPPGSANKYAVDSLYRNLKDLSQTDIFDWFLEVIIGDVPTHNKTVKLDGQKGFQIQLNHGTSNVDSYVWPWDPFLIKQALLRPYHENGYKKEDCNLILFGHTHLPTLYQVEVLKDETIEVKEPIVYQEPTLLNGKITVLNPGSVGLPRDADSRASYVILDTDQLEITFYRLDYDLDLVADILQEKRYCDEMTVRLFEAPIPTPRDNPPPDTYRTELKKRSTLG